MDTADLVRMAEPIFLKLLKISKQDQVMRKKSIGKQTDFGNYFSANIHLKSVYGAIGLFSSYSPFINLHTNLWGVSKVFSVFTNYYSNAHFMDISKDYY